MIVADEKSFVPAPRYAASVPWNEEPRLIKRGSQSVHVTRVSFTLSAVPGSPPTEGTKTNVCSPPGAHGRAR